MLKNKKLNTEEAGTVEEEERLHERITKLADRLETKTIVKALTPQNAEAEIKRVVYGLRDKLQIQRELSLEDLYRSLIIALHSDSLWKKAKWR